MTVRGLAERTKECYIEAVARLARHYDQSPDLLDPTEVEAYLLHLVKDRKLSFSSVNHTRQRQPLPVRDRAGPPQRHRLAAPARALGS